MTKTEWQRGQNKDNVIWRETTRGRDPQKDRELQRDQTYKHRAI